MKYFAIESSLNEKIMGKIPQVKEFIHSYDANEESKLIDKFIFKKIEIQPILSNAVLYSNAKQTDFIDTYGNVGFLSGYLISNKFKQLLEQFNCYGIQFFPTHLIQKNKEVNGYWQTHIYDFPYDCIDFVKTEFFSKNSETMKVNFQEKLNISNANELSNIIKSLEYPNSLFIKNIFFTDKMNYDFFKLRFFENGGSYGIVSEKFKNEFEKQDCTGIEFRPIELSLQDWYHSGEREKNMERFKHKIMKIKYLILLLLPTILFSQNKTIVPSFGTIVFNINEIITDTEKYKKSLDEMVSKIVDFQIEKELAESLMKLNADSAQINELKQTLKNLVEEDLNLKIEEKDLKYHQCFKKRLVINYTTFNNNVIENYNIINTNKKAIKIIAKDSTTIISDNVPYKYNQNEIIEITEFKGETKNINGFECFKVIMLYKPNNDENNEFECFMNQYIHKRELWVTDKIKCNYHPIIDDKEIMTKYYPLEITESNEAIKGYQKNYKAIIIILS